MRTTNSNGNTEVYMPKDVDGAINKLASLGSLGAQRQWEQAAIVSLICESKGRGRPSKTTKVSSFKKMSIDELARKGIYGLKSKDSIRACLKAWEMSGQPPVVPGLKIELPSRDYPDITEIYTVNMNDPAPAPDAVDDGTDDDATEDEDEAQDVAPSPRPTPTPRPEVNLVDKLLEVFDHYDPTDVIKGQGKQQVSLLIKTLESWVESLREAVAAEDDE